MTERDQAISLLKQVRAISQSAAGSQLPLDKPPFSQRTSTDERWVVAMELWHVASNFNENQAEPAVADITRLATRLKQLYGIKDGEIE